MNRNIKPVLIAVLFGVGVVGIGMSLNWAYHTLHSLVNSEPVLAQCEGSECHPEPTPFATPGMGSTGYMDCIIPEWFPFGPELYLPPVICEQGQVSGANPNCHPPNCTPGEGGGFRCEECAVDYKTPNPAWVRDAIDPVLGVPPTNQDWGQKDGTGKRGTDREYPWWDYQYNAAVEIPPFWFGLGGGTYVWTDDEMAATSALSSTNFTGATSMAGTTAKTGYVSTAEAGAKVPQDVPCGWPTNSQYRTVMAGCSGEVGSANGDPDTGESSGYCPDDAGYGSQARCDGSEHSCENCSGYTAVDIAGAAPVYSTQAGMMYRCVDMTNQCEGCQSYGVYVKVVGTEYTTLYAHLVADPRVDSQMLTHGDGIGCGLGHREIMRKEVKRGDFLGYAGLTGDTQSMHLNYEIRDEEGHRVCPASFMDHSNTLCEEGGTTGGDSFLDLINPFSSKNESTTPSSTEQYPAPNNE